MTKPFDFPVEEKIKAAARAVEPNRAFSDGLWEQIAGQPRQPAARTPFFQRIFPRPVWITGAAVMAVALTIVLVGPYRVANAFGSLLGYLPGIGFVQEDAGTRYLQAPTSVKEDGATLTVEQAVADENNTVIAYTISGLPEDATACFYDDNRVRTPDGKILRPMGGGVQGSQARIEYPPLPDGVDHITLLAGQNAPDPACSGPESWSIDITLGPIPPAVTLAPVINLEAQPAAPAEAPTDAGAAEAGAAEAGAADAAAPADIRFAFDQAVMLEDGYLVTGHTLWGNEDWENARIDFGNFEVVDAKGQVVPLEPSDEDLKDNAFAFKMLGKTWQGPFTLRVKTVSISAILDAGPSFSFDSGASDAGASDAGAHPQVGQSWALDETLDVLGQRVIFHSARAIHAENSTLGASAQNTQEPNGYAFEVDKDAAIDFIGLAYTGSEAVGMGWGWGQTAQPNPAGGEIYEMVFPDGLPVGPVTIQVRDVRFHINGDWQTEWNLP